MPRPRVKQRRRVRDPVTGKLVWPDRLRKIKAQREAEDMKEYLRRFSALFGVEVNEGHLVNATDAFLRYLDRIRRYAEILPEQLPVLLYDSIEHAIYLIARRFGYAGTKLDDPCIDYAFMKNRFIQAMGDDWRQEMEQDVVDGWRARPWELVEASTAESKDDVIEKSVKTKKAGTGRKSSKQPETED